MIPAQQRSARPSKDHSSKCDFLLLLTTPPQQHPAAQSPICEEGELLRAPIPRNHIRNPPSCNLTPPLTRVSGKNFRTFGASGNRVSRMRVPAHARTRVARSQKERFPHAHAHARAHARFSHAKAAFPNRNFGLSLDKLAAQRKFFKSPQNMTGFLMKNVMKMQYFERKCPNLI